MRHALCIDFVDTATSVVARSAERDTHASARLTTTFRSRIHCHFDRGHADHSDRDRVHQSDRDQSYTNSYKNLTITLTRIPTRIQKICR